MARTAKTKKKIELLQALIDHKGTGEAERAAARRAIERAHAAAADLGVDITNGWIDRREYGAKYEQVKTLTLTQIAALMRADVKLAVKLGRKATAPGTVALLDALGSLPAGVQVSIRTRYYSGGGAIDITVKKIPREWGFVWEANRWGAMCWMPSPALAAVVADLSAIHWAYNYDGSDPYTDHFDRNYYGHVDYERPYDRAS